MLKIALPGKKYTTAGCDGCDLYQLCLCQCLKTTYKHLAAAYARLELLSREHHALVFVSFDDNGTDQDNLSQ